MISLCLVIFDSGLGLFRRQFDEALADVAVGQSGLVVGGNVVADVPPGEPLVTKLPDQVEEPDAYDLFFRGAFFPLLAPNPLDADFLDFLELLVGEFTAFPFLGGLQPDHFHQGKAQHGVGEFRRHGLADSLAAMLADEVGLELGGFDLGLFSLEGEPAEVRGALRLGGVAEAVNFFGVVVHSSRPSCKISMCAIIVTAYTAVKLKPRSFSIGKPL